MTETTVEPIAGRGALFRPEPFHVELERFQGPLDLLLHLIRAQDIDIFDIPIARITQQFQIVLSEGFQMLELDRAGEFLEMAATLVRIKAQLLLPRQERVEWEDDPRAELVRRLLEYEHFREVAHVLSSAEAERARHFAKGHLQPRSAPALQDIELELTLAELLDAAARMPEAQPEAIHRAPVRVVTVSEKISLLRRLVRKGKRLAFDKLFKPWGTRPHAVASLLAVLETARQQVIRIEQAQPFDPIWLHATDKAEKKEEGEAE